MCWSSLRGPSPRVRGTGPARPAAVESDRSIPACAGNSQQTRVRVGATRSIPACAGNSCLARVILKLLSVHPRVCGEQDHGQTFQNSQRGPSPRVRGTVSVAASSSVRVRSIPACAGNSHVARPMMAAGAVHPRVCGEQVQSSLPPGGITGPSPRVRGTGTALHRAHPQNRSIPACAGNRTLIEPCKLPLTVHPRVCGEQARGRRRIEAQVGPSPRVRGTGAPTIPACPPATVHPRVCGEQVDRPATRRGGTGPSPRVRGTDRNPPQKS